MEEADFLRDRLMNLQERLEGSSQAGDTHIDYLHTLYALIDKEHSIFTRLKLIDSFESRRAIENLDSYKIIAFLPAAEQAVMTPAELYPAVKEELIELIKEMSGDDWHPEDFDIDDEDW
jgi:hypothetical protein